MIQEFETIDEITEIKREQKLEGRSQKEAFTGVFLVLTEDSFVILREGQRSRISAAIASREWVDALTFTEIEDIVFPSLKKLREASGRRFVFRLISDKDVVYSVTLSEASFFLCRRLLRADLSLNEAENVVFDASEKAKISLEWLEEHPGSLALFEELVLRRKVVSAEEFFGASDELRARLEKNFEPQIVERMMGFIAFDSVTVDGQRVVLFTREDKELLIECFPAVRAEFERRNFDGLNDRLEEELAFWNLFFENQKINRSILWGGIGELDRRRASNRLPDFVKSKLEKLERDPQLELPLNLPEISTVHVTDRFANVGNTESTALVESINNLSQTILANTIRDAPVPSLVSTSNGVSNPSTAPPAPSIQSRRREPSPPSNDPVFQREFRAWAEAQKQPFEAKIEDSSLAFFFQKSAKDKNAEVLGLISLQTEKALDGAANALAAEGVYEKAFRLRYVGFHERVVTTLKAFYGLFPLNQTQESKRKLSEVTTSLKETMKELKAVTNSLKSTMDADSAALHTEAVYYLGRLIFAALNKVKDV